LTIYQPDFHKEYTMEGINIFSGEPGLGGALTNPTEMAKRKGCIDVRYPVTYHSRAYPDVELAYHVLATGDAKSDDELMANLISQKFLQHPALMEEVTTRGGVAFLEVCGHFTNARSERFQSWEGQGRESRFIRNLIAGYEKALTGEVLLNGQPSLF
jgi:hypothetical protein